MLAKVKTAAVVGLDAQEVEVEVDILSGLPAVKMALLSKRGMSLPISIRTVLWGGTEGLEIRAHICRERLNSWHVPVLTRQSSEIMLP